MKELRGLVGQFVTASLSAESPWVRSYEEDEDDDTIYLDVYYLGKLIYCDGESCQIEEIDEERREVRLSNDMLDKNMPGGQSFTISYEQFITDFGDGLGGMF